jgi:hypothetical protein
VPKRYSEAGLLAIDIKAAEREMKRIAIGGKNCLIVGSPTGWQRAAVPLSVPSTWQLTPTPRPASCKPFLSQECRRRAAEEEDVGTVDRLFERIRARLMAEPERYSWRYILVAALLTRR